MKKACPARASRGNRKTCCKRATEDQNPGEPLSAISVIMREMENLCVRDTGKEMCRGKKQKCEMVCRHHAKVIVFMDGIILQKEGKSQIESRDAEKKSSDEQRPSDCQV